MEWTGLSIQALIMRLFGYEWEHKIDINKTEGQFFGFLATIRADFIELAHISFGGGVDLFNRFGFKILVFQDKFFHFDRIQYQGFQATEDVGMFAGEKGSDLGKSGKDDGYLCVNNSFQKRPEPVIQIIGLVDNDKKVGQSANRFQVTWRSLVVGVGFVIQLMKNGGQCLM